MYLAAATHGGGDHTAVAVVELAAVSPWGAVVAVGANGWPWEKFVEKFNGLLPPRFKRPRLLTALSPFTISTACHRSHHEGRFGSTMDRQLSDQPLQVCHLHAPNYRPWG